MFIGLFLALSAAQLWPSLEFTALSVRAGVGYAFASGGFPLSDTAQVLLPGLLSDFSPLYVGLIPLGLALLGIIHSVTALTDVKTRHTPRSTPGDRSPAQSRLEQIAPLFFALLGTVALLVSYGNNGFLYPVFYRWAPGWAMFRGQERGVRGGL